MSSLVRRIQNGTRDARSFMGRGSKLGVHVEVAEHTSARRGSRRGKSKHPLPEKAVRVHFGVPVARATRAECVAAHARKMARKAAERAQRYADYRAAQGER